MDPYVILLSGVFGYGEIELKDVVSQLASANGRPLVVRISSIGGDVETGVGIRNALTQYVQEHKTDITFDLLGWAQSAASHLTTIPGAKVVVRPNTLWMMHNPQTNAFGDHNTIQSRLNSWLLPITELYRADYRARSASPDEVVTQLDAETYLMGQEIIDAGYADELVEDTAVTASGGRDELISLAREEQERFKLVAMGNRENRAPAQLQELEDNMSKPNDSGQNGAAATGAGDDAASVAVRVAEERAKAYGMALRTLPAEMHESVQTAYDGGQDASYFDGMVAHHNAQASAKAAAEEANKHAAAKAEGDKVGDLPTNGTGQPAPAIAQAAGETGTTVEVG